MYPISTDKISKGLFAEIDGSVSDVGLVSATFVMPPSSTELGGALTAYNLGSVRNCYATGSIKGPRAHGGAYVGGLIGTNAGTIEHDSSGGIVDADWDTDTSGIDNLSQGVGNIANDPGITGLFTAQFQSGLPQGFDPKIWGEKANINGGLPYLLANPPVK